MWGQVLKTGTWHDCMLTPKKPVKNSSFCRRDEPAKGKQDSNKQAQQAWNG
jgi:hypothetical protein